MSNQSIKAISLLISLRLDGRIAVKHNSWNNKQKQTNKTVTKWVFSHFRQFQVRFCPCCGFLLLSSYSKEMNYGLLLFLRNKLMTTMMMTMIYSVGPSHKYYSRPITKCCNFCATMPRYCIRIVANCFPSKNRWLCIAGHAATLYAALQACAVHLKQHIGTVVCRHVQ